MSGQKSDVELLEAWCGGDNRAGEHLIRRHFPSLERFFANKAPESEQADLIQATMLECIRAKDGFRGEAQFRTFLLSIARNVLLHHYRQRSRKLDKLDPLADSVAALSTEGLFSKLVKEGEREMLMIALRQLPLDLQTVLELTYWECLTAQECAVILGIPANTVSGRIRRARQKLGEVLKAMRQGAEPAESGDSDAERRLKAMREFLGADPREVVGGPE